MISGVLGCCNPRVVPFKESPKEHILGMDPRRAMEFADGSHSYAEECEEFSSDLTDSESGEDATCGFTLELPVVPPARCLKRRYDGVFVDSAVVLERRSRRRIHEQFALLRAAVPDLCSVSSSFRPTLQCVTPVKSVEL